MMILVLWEFNRKYDDNEVENAKWLLCPFYFRLCCVHVISELYIFFPQSFSDFLVTSRNCALMVLKGKPRGHRMYFFIQIVPYFESVAEFYLLM